MMMKIKFVVGFGETAGFMSNTRVFNFAWKFMSLPTSNKSIESRPLLLRGKMSLVIKATNYRAKKKK
jgi:hypothetical protein